MLAVSTPKRSQGAPDIPTVAVAGLPGYDATTWFGMVTPVGATKDIIARLNAESIRILQTPESRDRLIAAGFDPAGSSAEELAACSRAEIDRWAKVIKSTGIRIE